MTEETCSALTELLKGESPAKIHIGSETAEALITFADINLLQNASSTHVLQNQMRVLKSGTSIPSQNYIRDGKIDNGAIASLLHDGFTVDYRFIENRWPRIKKFCDQLQSAILSSCDFTLSQDLSVNMYLTPPGTQGLKPHYDRENVLVIQVGGEKKWSLYPSPEPFPTQDSGRQNPPPESLLFSDTLRIGDVLYIPGGFVHEAETSTTSSSLHLTISLWKLTWIDFFQTLMKRLPHYREPLKTQSLRGSDNPMMASPFKATRELDSITPKLFKESLDELITLTTARYSQLQDNSLESYLRAGSGFDGNATYRLASPHVEFYETEFKISVSIPGSLAEFDRRFHPTLSKLLALKTFSFAHLPEHIDKLAAGFVMRTLWIQGFIRSV